MSEEEKQEVEECCGCGSGSVVEEEECCEDGCKDCCEHVIYRYIPSDTEDDGEID